MMRMIGIDRSDDLPPGSEPQKFLEYIIGSMSFFNKNIIPPFFAPRITNYQEIIHLTQYSYVEGTWNLPLDVESLLMLLGGLDEGIHALKGIAAEQGGELRIYYPLGNDSLEQSEILRKTLAANKASYSAPSQSLTRYAASWIVAELTKTPELKAHQEIIATLSQLLATKDFSLSHSIREKLYPDPSMAVFLEKNCKGEPIIADLLNPAIPFPTATKSLVAHISSMMTRPKVSSVSIYDPQQLEPLSKQVWEPWVKSLFGKTADDGGVYREGYTEIALLLQANKGYTPDGRFALDFRHTKVYQENYAVGEEFHYLLEGELRKACGLMGLKLLPNQNIHQGFTYFTDVRVVSLWFENFLTIRHKLWVQMVKTLYSKAAPDGGNYTNNYTEIRLLKEATISFDGGKFALQFSHTNDYKNGYAPGKKWQHVLREELYTACNLLRLKLSPNQDVHKGFVYFTPETDLYLRNCGFHISERYCKSLMRASHYFRLFKLGDEESNPFKPLPSDINTSIINTIEPQLSRFDIETMMDRRFK